MDSPDQPTHHILRGKLTRFRLFTTCVLACWLGFVPGFVNPQDLSGGFAQAPGLILSIAAIVLILRCNLILFGITVALAKLLALQMVGVAFDVGRVLLDGPLSGLFEKMINAPFLAWCGLEYYATSGGLLLGTVIGIVWFILMGRVLRTSVPADVVEGRKLGLPLRLSGIVAVVVMIGAGWALQELLGSKIFRSSMKDGLEYGNGATVDVAGLELNLTDGEIVIDGLAMADAAKLDFDLFRASKLKLKLGTTELLSRRLVIKDITSEAAQTRVKRTTPGVPVGDPVPLPPPDPKDGDKTLDDYLNDAKVWEQHLQQANRWIEAIFRSPTDESDDERTKRIDRELKTKGPAGVAATHLITGSPLLLVEKMSLVNIAIGNDESDSIDIQAHNISTNPSLVTNPASISIKSRKNRFGLDLKLNASGGGASGTLFHNAIPVDAIVAQFKQGGSKSVSGGTMGITLGGTFELRGEGLWLDVPLNVALQNTTLNIKGMKPTTLDKLELPLGLRGPLSAPRIRLDESKLADALVAAGRAELAGQLRKQTDKLLGDKVPANLKGTVNDVLTGKGEEAAKKAAAKATEDAKKKAEEELRKKAADALKKKLPGGLFGGKKKK